jgi:hypothetical protein
MAHVSDLASPVSHLTSLSSILTHNAMEEEEEYIDDDETDEEEYSADEVDDEEELDELQLQRKERLYQTIDEINALAARGLDIEEIMQPRNLMLVVRAVAKWWLLTYGKDGDDDLIESAFDPDPDSDSDSDSDAVVYTDSDYPDTVVANDSDYYSDSGYDSPVSSVLAALSDPEDSNEDVDQEVHEEEYEEEYEEMDDDVVEDVIEDVVGDVVDESLESPPSLDIDNHEHETLVETRDVTEDNELLVPESEEINENNKRKIILRSRAVSVELPSPTTLAEKRLVESGFQDMKLTDSIQGS